MLLDSKVDKQVHRYLKKISYNTCSSRFNETVHYFIRYESENCEIRFSGHYSSRLPSNNVQAFMQIIKCSNELYRVHIGYIQLMIKENVLLNYVKAAILWLPEIYLMFRKVSNEALSIESTLNKSTQKHKTEIRKLTKEINKLKSTDWFIEATNIDRKLSETTDKLKQSNASLNMANNKIKSLEEKVNRLTRTLTGVRNAVGNFK